MKIIIDIPKDVITDIKECDFDFARNAVRHFQATIADAIKSGKSIPNNATNGDIVEKIFGKDVYCTLIRMMYSSCCGELKDWWNAPYRKGEE